MHSYLREFGCKLPSSRPRRGYVGSVVGPVWGGGRGVQNLEHMCFYVFLCGTPGRVRAFRHLASDSPPCACPIDLPRVQALGQELFFGDQKGLQLSSRSKVRANGCRGEAPKKLQSGRPVSGSLGGPPPLQPLLDSASSTVFYVVLETLWGPRFTYSCACFGARILRTPGGALEVPRR